MFDFFAKEYEPYSEPRIRGNQSTEAGLIAADLKHPERGSEFPDNMFCESLDNEMSR